VVTEPTPKDTGQDRPSRPDPGSRGHIGWIVAGSLATGLVAAVLLAAAPFIPAEESAVTGAVLCGFALGWAMLAVLSVRFTDQPQRWAAAPALVMGLGGLPGQLIDVGGHRLHLSCTGSGTPTVVLEPGRGELSSNLGWIAPAVARDSRVCVYDRAGRGWSEPADTAQDGAQIATDLHTLLQRGHVPGPYVLAGHSFGGLYVLTFAARYPDEVAGMVLVDSTAPASAANPGTASPGHGGMSRVSALVSAAARLGLGRLYAQSAFGSLPPRSRDEVRASVATPSTLGSTIDEYVQATVSSEQAAALGDFADKPLIVLTAGRGHDAAWSAAQNRMARLSTNSVHRVIDGATHEDLITDEEDAAATTQAILDVVSSVRSKGALVS
jgi:pimeloyl-ACP methyl ester carboxylesterase